MKLDFRDAKTDADVKAVMENAAPQFEALKKYADELQKRTDKVQAVLKDGTVAGNLHQILPEKELPLAAIKHITLTEKDVSLDNLRAAINGRPDHACPAGTYTRLFVRSSPEKGWTLIMSDTPYEIRAGRWFTNTATGDVLIIGLGIGATLIPVLRKNTVRSVTVIEKNPDVIALVEENLRNALAAEGEKAHRKLEVIPADGFTWRAPRGVLYDTIWLDIWPEICQSNLPEITKLKRRYARRLNRHYNKNSWMGAWEEHYLRRLR
jgi:16S rRNA A1518/A1519 N6-dimethyltransferase RsmA/KsgA/DIM1 with predicted DNA glycosylase/AP lyase activity